MSDHIVLETPAETRDRCAKHGATWLGDESRFTTRTDGSVKRSGAVSVFERHGFGSYLPKDSKTESFLTAAARRAKGKVGGNKYLTKPFVSPNKDTPMAVHVTRVDAGNGEAGDDFTCHARVRISYRNDPVTGLTEPFAVAKPPEGQAEFSDSCARDIAVAVAKDCNERMEFVKTDELGRWLRAVHDGIGGCKSLGGGNNFFVPASQCDQLDAFMREAEQVFGIVYLRDPKTTMGASHVKAVVTETCKASIQTELAELQLRLGDVVDKDGKRAKGKRLSGQVAEIERIAAKLDLYKGIVEDRVMAPIVEMRLKLKGHFETLLDGGTVSLKNEPADDGGDEPTDDGPDGGNAVPAVDETLAPPPAKVEPKIEKEEDPFAWCAS